MKNIANIDFEREKHENELLNHRLTWMWVIQGILFTAFCSNSAAKYDHYICIVGIISSFSIGLSLLNGTEALDSLHGNGAGRRLLSLLFPWSLLPLFMACVWWWILNENPEMKSKLSPFYQFTPQWWGTIAMSILYSGIYMVLWLTSPLKKKAHSWTGNKNPR